jgi:hypothetical protein
MAALDELKDDLVSKDQWRENDGFIDRGPFPPPKTAVAVRLLTRDEETGEVVLRLEPVHADQVYYEFGGSPATTGSPKVDNLGSFKTSELLLSFLAVDSKGQHETGPAKAWRNSITLKYRLFQNGKDKCCELHAAPDAQIRYTTNGSDPKTSGGTYAEPFIVPPGTVFVLAMAEKAGVVSEQLRVGIDWGKDDAIQLDLFKTVLWKRHHDLKSTKDTYEFIGRLKKYEATAVGPRLYISGEHNIYIELNFDPKLEPTPEKIEESLHVLRTILTDGQVWLETNAVRFPSGQALMEWIAEAKTELKPNETQQ